MEFFKTKLSENKFLWEQEINSKERQINLFIGLGLMNTKGDISIDLPIDILIIIGALLELKKTFDLKIVFILADQNAILQIDQGQSCKINEINLITELYYKKLENILKYFDLIYCSSIIKASSLVENENYKEIKLPQNNYTPYENEQLRTMKYFKNIGYNYRLSWKGDKKRKHTNRDEEYFDNLYKKCLNENPMISIYIKSGKKSLPHGLGTAIPYSYYESEKGSRLPFEIITNLNFANEKIKSHTEGILTYFIKDGEINKESFNCLIRKCLYSKDEFGCKNN